MGWAYLQILPLADLRLAEKKNSSPGVFSAKPLLLVVVWLRIYGRIYSHGVESNFHEADYYLIIIPFKRVKCTLYGFT